METESRTSRSTFFTGESANHSTVLRLEREIESVIKLPQVRLVGISLGLRLCCYSFYGHTHGVHLFRLTAPGGDAWLKGPSPWYRLAPRIL